MTVALEKMSGIAQRVILMFHYFLIHIKIWKKDVPQLFFGAYILPLVTVIC